MKRKIWMFGMALMAAVAALPLGPADSAAFVHCEQVECFMVEDCADIGMNCDDVCENLVALEPGNCVNAP